MTAQLSGNEIREAFLKFFKEKHNHTLFESSSLVPNNPTVLLTTAGMLQFVPYFLGLEQPNFSPARAVSCQKCARAGGKDSDIENVGRTPRHHTFFEMLGNFSFGDYFKDEIIEWSWDFVTNYLKLDKNRLWITIYQDDDESFKIWNEKIGVPAEKIIRKGKKDNFWGPPGATGSCGPCSEIHYDLGENLKCSDDCSVATCECDRWVEIWNLVFTDLFKDEEGNFSPLAKKNVDTGMGLERITMVVQGKTSTFETDLLKPILDDVSKMSGVTYKKSEKTDISLRIITDHARCVTFMINDGIVPGNEGRSYVLRMILRRALRHGKMLGLELPFLYKLVDTIIASYKEAYPELEKNKDKIIKTIRMEEERFKVTLDRGYKLIEEWVEKKENIDGETAFKLYDTFGFPLELTVEIAQENGLNVDIDGFNAAMKEQKERAKAATQKISLTDDLVYVEIENKFGATNFVGYEKDCSEAKVIATVEAGGFLDIILDKTPFYAESGGQVGDTGILENSTFKADVLNTFKVNKLFVHRTQVINGEIAVGDTVQAAIDSERRRKIEIHHTNAHLLQAALVKVLGDEVKQAGSQVEDNRTRFDFSFSRAMSKEELDKVENYMNKWIAEKIALCTKVMDINEAKKTGATALFGEKYEDKVRVVTIENISSEFCGGAHAKNTADLRLVKIVSESAIAAGVRRIEAVCADCAFTLLNNKAHITDELAQKFKVAVPELTERISKLQEENHSLNTELEHLKAESVKNKFSAFIERAKTVTNGKIFISKLANIEPQYVKVGIELLSDKLGESVIVLCPVNTNTDQVSIFVKVSEAFVKNGVNAGKLVAEIAAATDGKGGGRPNFAQGGGKSSANLDDALQKIENYLINLD